MQKSISSQIFCHQILRSADTPPVAILYRVLDARRDSWCMPLLRLPAALGSDTGAVAIYPGFGTTDLTGGIKPVPPHFIFGRIPPAWAESAVPPFRRSGAPQRRGEEDGGEGKGAADALESWERVRLDALLLALVQSRRLVIPRSSAVLDGGRQTRLEK